MRILIVDDSPDDRLLLQTILKKAGYTDLKSANSAAEAFALLSVDAEQGGEPAVDIVLLDVLMPGMDGLEALGRLKADPRLAGLPVVMVTGNQDVGDLATAFAAGAVDYITKPFNKVELLARIHSVVALEKAHCNLRRSQQRLKVLTASLAEGLLGLDLEGCVVFLNPAGERLLGVRESLVRGSHYATILYSREEIELVGAVLAGQVEQSRGETVLERADGATFPASYTVAAITTRGERGGAVVSFQDITQRKEAEERLQLAARVIEASTEGVMVTDGHNRIQEVNPAFTYITGYTREDALGQDPKMLSSGQQDAAFYRAMWQSLERSDRWQGEIWNRRKGGELYPQWLSISVIRGASGEVSHYVGIFSDITTRKMAERRLEQLAHYDILTGLPNRMLMQDRLQQALAKAKRHREQVAVLYLDLDNFKPVNDNFGHEAGDMVLRVVARRLKGSIRKSDTVARIGGDEFLVVLEDVQQDADAIGVAEKIIDTLSREIPLNQTTCRIGCSIGISLYPRDAKGLEKLIKKADDAMYRAKQAGRNRYVCSADAGH